MGIKGLEPIFLYRCFLHIFLTASTSNSGRTVATLAPHWLFLLVLCLGQFREIDKTVVNLLIAVREKIIIEKSLKVVVCDPTKIIEQ